MVYRKFTLPGLALIPYPSWSSGNRSRTPKAGDVNSFFGEWDLPGVVPVVPWTPFLHFNTRGLGFSWLGIAGKSLRIPQTENGPKWHMRTTGFVVIGLMCETGKAQRQNHWEQAASNWPLYFCVRPG